MSTRSRTRLARYGASALVLVVSIVSIVVLLNYLSARYYRRFDVTAGNLHTLSPQSIEVLEALDGEIEVVGVYPSGQGRERYERWLDEYRAHTDRIRYRAIDPNRQPGEADRLGWNLYGSGLVVRSGPHAQYVRAPDEPEITGALLRVHRGAPRTVYFTTGHGEPSPSGTDPGDYGRAAALLADHNYAVRTLNLAISSTVPSDASLVVVASPQTPLLAGERDTLRTYLQNGGRALALIDPGGETGIDDVLVPWGVRYEDKVVVDLQRNLGGDPLTPVIDRYEFSQITKNLPMLALPLAGPIVGPDDPEGTSYAPLGTTSERSWADADVQEDGVIFDEGTDLRGPLVLLATIDDAGTRIVLLGDSDLLANDVLAQIPNGEHLLLNAVDWLAQEESLLAIPPKANVPHRINLTTAQETAVGLGALVAIPAAIVIAGVVVWWRRRWAR